MGDYSFERFNSRDFEHMIQALSRKVLGNGTIIFGDGPDGQREATFEGKCIFPSEAEQWDGYWVVQAKFKYANEKDDDYIWLRSQIKSELDKYSISKGKKTRIPNNYIFFTNIRLTPVLETGIRDKIEEFCDIYRKRVIPNIKIFGYHDLCRFLDDSRDIATSYASFVLPGDILNELYKKLGGLNNVFKEDSFNLMSRFLEKEFKDDMFSRLEQGGQLTNDKVNLEKIFIDLYATKDGTISGKTSELKFISSCINKSNISLKPDTESEEKKFVLIGSAGQGKSTLSQFLCQIYRAYFLCEIDKCKPADYIKKFIDDYCKMDIVIPKCYRYPFRIILKDYAGWLSLRKNEKKLYSILSYLKYRLETKGEGEIEIECLRRILQTLSFVFVFDGLDEVPLSSNRNDVLEEINNFIDIELRRENCDALIIATTRPQGYTKEFDDTKYKHLYITDLNEENCIKYLERLMINIESSQEQREKYLEILHRTLKDDVISRLMKTPLQATILAILVRSGGEPPRNRYNLFTDYYQTILKREKQKGIIRILNEYPDYIEDIHLKLGFKLQLLSENERNPSSNISFQEFESFVKEYLFDDIGLENFQVDIYTKEILQAITHRLVFITEIEDGKVGFSIRSMQEYFAANYYLRNQPPEAIPDRLKMISQSAYWRNTFLFILGYIYRHKEYLIGIVDSICGELNGSSDDFSKRNGKNISYIGSWLALDILNEGVFRCKPKDENKFIRYLDNLFLLSPCDNHSYLSKLPNEIKEKILLKLIEKYLAKEVFCEQLTAWTIAGYLLNHGYEKVTVVMDKYWYNNKNVFVLLKHLYSIGMESNDWYLEKAIEALDQIDIFNFQRELDHILFKSIQTINTRISEAVKCSLIQITFFGTMIRSRNRYKLDFSQIINTLTDFKIDSKENGNGNLFIEVPQFRIEIMNGLHFTFRSITYNNINLLKKIGEVFDYYKIRYLSLLIQFLIDPNKDNLLKYLLELKECQEVFEYQIKAIQRFNWVLNKLFYLFPKRQLLDNAIEYVKNNKLGDISDWNQVEENIKNKTISNDFLAREIPSIGFLFFESEDEELFYNFRELCYNFNEYREYKGFYNVRLLGLFFDYYEENREIAVKILSNNDILNELLESCYYEEYRKNFFADDLWVFLISFASCKKIMELSSRNYDSWFQLNGHFFDDDKEYLIQAYDKILKVILTLESETSMLKALPYIVQDSIDINKLQSIRYDFSYLHKSRYKNVDNEISRILICLLDYEMTKEKWYELKRAIEQIGCKEFKIFKQIINLFETCRINAGWVEEFLSEVYSLIDKNAIDSHVILSRYEGYIKNLIETYPSGLSGE